MSRYVGSCLAEKGPGDQLFETFDAQDLNKELKNIMDGEGLLLKQLEATYTRGIGRTITHTIVCPACID